MKAQHPIDELFRKELEKYQLEAPMHLWSGIAPSVEPKRPDQPYRHILRGLLLGISLSLLCLADSRFYPGFKHPTPTLDTTTVIIAATPSTPVPNSISSTPYTPLEVPKSAADYDRPVKRRLPLGANIPKNRRRKPPHLLVPALPNADIPTGMPTTAAPETHTPSIRETLPEVAPIPLWKSSLDVAPIQDFMPGIRFLGARWYASYDIAYSQEWAQRSLHPVSPDIQPYVDQRKASETFQNAHSATIRLALISASGITLKSGIQVSRIAERFTQTRDEQITLVTPIKDATGQITGMDTTIQHKAFTWSNQNTFHTVDIPFLLGYEFAVGQLNIGLSGGALLNMAFNQKGAFLGPDGHTVLNFSSNLPDAYPAFKNRLGVGWYGSTQFSFPVTPSVRVLAEPYFRVFPQSYTNKDYPIEQRYRSAGIFIGIRKLLGPYWLNLRP